MKSMTRKIDSGSIPAVFSNGTAVYNKLAKTYIRHDKGCFILAPSGIEKSYYVNGQQENRWIDGDVLWVLGSSNFFCIN